MNARDKSAVKRLRDGVAQLKREKSQLLQWIADAPVGFALLDHNLGFVRINAALRVMDGHLANEHIGRPLREVMPEEASALEPLCRDVLRNQMPILNVQISSVPVNGSTKARVCLASLYAVRPDGKTWRSGKQIGLDQRVNDAAGVASELARGQAAQFLERGRTQRNSVLLPVAFCIGQEELWSEDLQGGPRALNESINLATAKVVSRNRRDSPVAKNLRMLGITATSAVDRCCQQNTGIGS